MDSADTIDFERGHNDSTGTVRLEVEERIGNAERHLMADLRRSERISDDEQCGHGADPSDDSPSHGLTVAISGHRRPTSIV